MNRFIIFVITFFIFYQLSGIWVDHWHDVHLFLRSPFGICLMVAFAIWAIWYGRKLFKNDFK